MKSNVLIKFVRVREKAAVGAVFWNFQSHKVTENNYFWQMAKNFVTLYSLMSILFIIKFGSNGIKTVGWSRSSEIFAAIGPMLMKKTKLVNTGNWKFWRKKNAAVSEKSELMNKGRMEGRTEK